MCVRCSALDRPMPLLPDPKAAPAQRELCPLLRAMSPADIAVVVAAKGRRRIRYWCWGRGTTAVSTSAACCCHCALCQRIHLQCPVTPSLPSSPSHLLAEALATTARLEGREAATLLADRARVERAMVLRLREVRVVAARLEVIPGSLGSLSSGFGVGAETPRLQLSPMRALESIRSDLAAKKCRATDRHRSP